MEIKENQNASKLSSKTIIYIIFAQLNGMLLFLAAIVWFGFLYNTSVSLQPKFLIPIYVIGLIPAGISLWIHLKFKTPENITNTIKSLKLDSPSKKQEAFYGRYFILMIITLALNEVLAIFGLVSFILNEIDQVTFYSVLGVVFTLNLFMFPRPDQMFEQVKHKLNV